MDMIIAGISIAPLCARTAGRAISVGVSRSDHDNNGSPRPDSEASEVLKQSFTAKQRCPGLSCGGALTGVHVGTWTTHRYQPGPKNQS